MAWDVLVCIRCCDYAFDVILLLMDKILHQLEWLNDCNDMNETYVCPSSLLMLYLFFSGA